MGIFEMIILGVSLAVDATAVAITNGLTYEEMKKSKMLIIAIAFGVFQAVMPLLGFYIMTLVSLDNSLQKSIQRSAGWIAFILLALIGLKMIIDAIKEMRSSDIIEIKKDITYKQILIQAVATSIDALAVGFSLYATSQKYVLENRNFSIFLVVSVILAITVGMSLLGGFFGKYFGKMFKKIAPIIGGGVLIGIGLSILLG